MTKAWKYGSGPADWEELTEAQANTDQHLVQRFTAAESNVAAEIPNEQSEADGMIEMANTLPTRRRAHWLAEFVRIGILVAEAPAPKNTSSGATARKTKD
jgi:hypothetical protein